MTWQTVQASPTGPWDQNSTNWWTLNPTPCSYVTAHCKCPGHPHCHILLAIHPVSWLSLRQIYFRQAILHSEVDIIWLQSSDTWCALDPLISVHVLGLSYRSFAWVVQVSNTDRLLYTEDDIMHITLHKREKGQPWPSAISGHGELDPLAVDQESRRLMLERFQEEVLGIASTSVLHLRSIHACLLPNKNDCNTLAPLWTFASVANYALVAK